MTRSTILACAAVLALGGCETAFVGRAPSGQFDLVQVNDGRLPFERAAGDCRRRIEGGRFELDSIARRFELELRGANSCTGPEIVRETGTYLRGGGRLTLETAGATARTFTASETGRSISLPYNGLRLRFQQAR